MLLPATGGAQRSRRAAATATATVQLGVLRQTIQGFGSSERSWTDPHLAKSPNVDVPTSAQDQILTSLYGDLGLTRARSIIDPGIQPSPGASFNFAAKTDAQAAFVEQAKRYGLRTFFPAPVYLENWMQPNDPGPYVDWAMALLRRWRALGATPPYYSVLNEPQVAKDFPPQWLHDVVVQLGQRMRADGFKTKLVIPDDENPIDAYRRAEAVLQDPLARQYVGAVAFHIYRIGGPSDWAKLHQLASRHGLPLWMTEYWSPSYTSYDGAFQWAVAMHNLLTIGDVSAIDYIWGFFGDWAGGAAAAPITIHFDSGRFVSWSKTPVYYFTGQYSKFVRPGFRRVAASSSDSSVLVSGYRGGKRAVAVVVNTASDRRALELRFTGGRVAKKVAVVQTTSASGLLPRPALRVHSGTIRTTLPPQSVTTFVSSR